MHNYDYYYILCLLLQVTCSLVNSFTYELMITCIQCVSYCELRLENKKTKE